MSKTTVDATPHLVHGGDWAAFSLEHGGALPLDFSANVSPLGTPDGVVDAIARAAHDIWRYPDPLCRDLVDALATHEGVDCSWVLPGSGAADLIFRAVDARRPSHALVCAPTFAEYESALRARGCEVRQHLLKVDRSFAVEEDILDAIGLDTDMVFLCQPNNPTGVSTSRDLLKRIADACDRAGALLVVDECFVDFLDNHEEITFVPELAQYPGLLILKAFTKILGMAGVRLGYCLSSDAALLERMRLSGPPWSVSHLAQQAGLAALKETDFVAGTRQIVRTERPWLISQLASLGFEVVPGEANFLLFKSRLRLEVPLRERGILIRSCANYRGLCDGWYRCAVRGRAENVQLIEALKEVLS